MIVAYSVQLRKQWVWERLLIIPSISLHGSNNTLNSHRWRKMVICDLQCDVDVNFGFALEGSGDKFLCIDKKQNRVTTHLLIHLHVNLLHSTVAWTASPITYKISSWIWLYINDVCGSGSQIYSKPALVLVLTNFPSHVWMETYLYFHQSNILKSDTLNETFLHLGCLFGVLLTLTAHKRIVKFFSNN